MHEDTLDQAADIVSSPPPSGLRRSLSYTTNTACLTRHQGSLDFAFFVHARSAHDILRTYPHLEGHAEEAVYEHFQRHHVHVASPIEVRLGESTLYGELIGVPLHPQRYRAQLRSVRESLAEALRYCRTRRTKIVGLGALLPSMTQYGRALIGQSDEVGITTGHSFTAHCIAEHVRKIEGVLHEPQTIAVVGAAGSTGRATIQALMSDGVPRQLVLVDLPERLSMLTEAFQQQTQAVRISSDLSVIKHSSVVVCVTNSATAIIRPEHLAPGCIVIDDAQPENITFETASQRPDVVVIKCLAHIPNLRCPFDFGLLKPGSDHVGSGIAFTCLAETVALAASGHQGHFTVGSPTSDQIQRIAQMASQHGIGIAPFYSFPEVGMVQGHPRFWLR